MEKKDIASLLDALCERPLAEEAGLLPPEQEALYRRALEAVAREGGSEAAARLAKDPEALAALLAAIHAGAETEAEREAFARAAAGSATVRLDSESALAFLSGIDEAPETAPTHLLASLETVHHTPAPTPRPRPWSLASLWPARRGSLRWASAFVVLVVAGGLSWSTFRHGDDVVGTMQPSVTMQPGVDVPSSAAMQSSGVVPPSALRVGSSAPAVQAMSNKPKPKVAAALAKPCQAGMTSMNAAEADKGAVAKRAATSPTVANGTACDDADRQLADKNSKAAEQLEALRRARAAVEAEIARREAELGASRKAAAGASLAQPSVLDSAAASRPSFGYGTVDSAMPAIPAVPPAAAFQQTSPAAAITRSPSLLSR